MQANVPISRLLRAGIIAVAAVGLLTSAVWLVSAQAQQTITAILSERQTAVVRAEQGRLPALERRASLVYLPAETRAAEGGIFFRLGQVARARAQLESLVSDQPNSVEAWWLLSIVETRSDPAAAAIARLRVRQLDPKAFGRPQ